MEKLNSFNNNHEGKYILPNQQVKHNQVKFVTLIDINMDLKDIIYECILMDPYKIMLDPKNYSMYLSVLNGCDKNQLTKLLQEMEKKPLQLIVASRDQYAAQIIKKLIQVARRLPIICWFPTVLAAAVVDLMNHKVGRDVIQTCFLELEKFMNQPLYDGVVRNCLALATDVNGCIALEKCIDYMDSCPNILFSGFDEDTFTHKSPRERLLETIAHHAARLALDPYGNYVLQHVVPRCDERNLEKISKGIEHLYEFLSTTKRGSYLVEKLLDTSFRSYVASYLLKSGRLSVIALDEYGNYVIQKLLRVTKVHNTDLYQSLWKKLYENLFAFEHSIFGKNVAKLIREAYREQIFASELFYVAQGRKF